MTSCTHPVVAGVFEVSHDATPPCVYHSPKESVTEQRPLLGLLTWALVLLVIAVLGYGLARLLSPPELELTPQLELSVEVDYMGAIVGEPHVVTARIRNTSAGRVSDVRFEIAEQSLEHFILGPVEPKPEESETRGIWKVLSYPALAPGERHRISLELIPKTAGAQHLFVRLVSEENEFHGVADLLIIVGDASPAAADPVERQGEESADETN
jgi:hypothetical protein